ncbi:MAG: hypothetical protein IJX76_10265 [Clostridia bacterium]|nr:hypothetical protein [Clostridia bacterium]
MTDHQIIDQFWARSETAIAEVQNRYGAAGEAVANNLLQNSADAEECVNDALLRLWNSIPPQRPVSLWAYFVKVIRNLALDRLRKKSAAKAVGLSTHAAKMRLSRMRSRLREKLKEEGINV